MPFDITLILGTISGILMFLAGIIVLIYRKKITEASFWVPTISGTLLAVLFNSPLWKEFFFGNDYVYSKNLENILPLIPSYFLLLFAMIFLFRWLKNQKSDLGSAFVLPISVSAIYGLQCYLAHDVLGDLSVDFTIAKMLHGALHIIMIYFFIKAGPVRNYPAGAKHGFVLSLFITIPWLASIYITKNGSPGFEFQNWGYILFVRQGIAVIFTLIIIFLLKPGTDKHDVQTEQTEDKMFQ